MKRSLLWALCLSVVSAFAGSYDISEFEAKESGSPDEYITAEFGGELKVAPADEVESLQDGRLVVRQKFEDPFDADATTYQLYQGGAGDLSSMTAMTAEGVDYSKLVTAKVYARRGMDANKDVEKVYFDGKSVFAPGLTSAIVFIDGNPVTLKGENAEEPATETAAAASSSNDEYCDDDDEDCEDDEDLSRYKTSAPVANSGADERDYAASEAADVGDRFGIADEVRFWSAVGLSALAATAIVLGINQHSEANKAKDAYDDLNELYTGLLGMCKGDKACETAMVQKGAIGTWTIQDLKGRMNTNKKTQDSYATARNLWFGLAGASIAGAVVLFVW
ncbi:MULTISPECIES: hypothetical protein [unclassified Fibrobacter]|uniref:hypothetical protein n=1 Tax=unclassified Fibrobacter TaxID=2634177 RepID=UPI000D6AAE6B|nr:MULTISPECIES: hypothetical protein [unclassified Fibrobacter]PWJ62733.1 hypothetical protein BGX12_12018 [Fibrobacter sp. UWR4]PZW66835.1 hypothetical protein C8E88_102818 [Fibrobacter sp. UWR1]